MACPGRGGRRHRARPVLDAEARLMAAPVWTRSFGNSRSGCYVDPSWPLTSTHVQQNGIRVIGQLKLDDARGTEGQILAVPNLVMRDGQKHNAVFVADMSN